MTLREFIINYRKEHDLSQRQLALDCGLSNGYISMIEKGRNHHTDKPVTPTLPQMKKLAEGMHMTITELLVAVDDMPVNLTDENKISTLDEEGGLNAEIADVIMKLNNDQKAEALRYLQFLASHGEK